MSAPIQIVDTNDRPLRAGTKQEVWEQGLMHRVVRIMIERPDGKLLLQHRSPTKDIFPNCWDNSAAGHVDAGEDYDTAAARELQEELGITDAKLQEAGRYFSVTDWHGLKMRRFTRVYKTMVNQTPQKLEIGKVDDVRWYGKEEIRQLVAKHPDAVTDGLSEVCERLYVKRPSGNYSPVVVVDDKDRVISEASLADARALGLIYRIVFVAAKDNRGRVLLQKRAPHLHMYPNCWDLSAGGHVDDGHSYEAAAQLELAEELGIEDATLQEVAHIYSDEPLGGAAAKRFIKIFQTPLEKTPTSFAPEEITEVRWFTTAECVKLITEHPEQVAEGLTQAYRQHCL